MEEVHVSDASSPYPVWDGGDKNGGGGNNGPPFSRTPEPQCTQIDLNYQIAPSVICSVCAIFGILYCFFGYRFFKATMFLTGFITGAIITYLICLEENLLPLEGKIGVSIASGILCGLITMLVSYVGLFMNGFNLGLLIGTGALIITEQFYHPYTKWIAIGVLFLTGLIFALMNLYFQRGLTIFGTSLFGAGLLFVAVDYFIEQFMMVRYVLDRMKVEISDPVCWFSWLILALCPVMFIVGSIAQWRVTGKGFDHHDTVVRRRRRKRKVHLQRAREREIPERPEPTANGSKYRHLYQVRRGNGDVIAQSYIQNINHKIISDGSRRPLCREANRHGDTHFVQIPC